MILKLEARLSERRQLVIGCVQTGHASPSIFPYKAFQFVSITCLCYHLPGASSCTCYLLPGATHCLGYLLPGASSCICYLLPGTSHCLGYLSTGESYCGRCPSRLTRESNEGEKIRPYEILTKTVALIWYKNIFRIGSIMRLAVND